MKYPQFSLNYNSFCIEKASLVTNSCSLNSFKNFEFFEVIALTVSLA